MARNRKKNLPSIKLKGQKFVGGGQVLAHDEKGRPIFAWGVLPGELAEIQLTKSKKDYAEGVAVKILEASKDRIEPKEDEYLSTSPWQILNPALEDQVKLNILQEQFERGGIQVQAKLGSKTEQFFNYRNKMEYCFWADEQGLQLSLRRRGSNQKIVVEGSALAQDMVNRFAHDILKSLNLICAEGRDLKSLIVRTSKNSTVGALFVKDQDFPTDQLVEQLEALKLEYRWGIQIYFSEPKSPASVPTKLIDSDGSKVLKDEINDVEFEYSPLSFFQGNIPIYEKSLNLMANHLDDKLPLVDMYSGVGSIGISLASENQYLSLIEIDEFNTSHAETNSLKRSIDTTKVITSSSEGSLEYIIRDINLILDPPRAGLHKSLTSKICEVKPKKLIYLSCNPATQARDVGLMVEAGYKISLGPVMFNFFPRTPHIESLVVLDAE